MGALKFLLFIIGMVLLMIGKYEYTTRANQSNNPTLPYVIKEQLMIRGGYTCFIVAFILAAFNI